MAHEGDDKLADNPKKIWLQPACNMDERAWCEDDIGCCDECGEPTVEYRRADLVGTEIASLRAALIQIRAVCEDNPNMATNFIDDVARIALSDEQKMREGQ
jgi:hypothetical protein